ncbi:uncharacterized protein LOC34622498 [Cyclospora cayetanensis]|nr:uncharacterized protein LOC34622498 [Cyclospora cayetanensis]
MSYAEALIEKPKKKAQKLLHMMHVFQLHITQLVPLYKEVAEADEVIPAHVFAVQKLVNIGHQEMKKLQAASARISDSVGRSKSLPAVYASLRTARRDVRIVQEALDRLQFFKQEVEAWTGEGLATFRVAAHNVVAGTVTQSLNMLNVMERSKAGLMKARLPEHLWQLAVPCFASTETASVLLEQVPNVLMGIKGAKSPWEAVEHVSAAKELRSQVADLMQAFSNVVVEYEPSVFYNPYEGEEQIESPSDPSGEERMGITYDTRELKQKLMTIMGLTAETAQLAASGFGWQIPSLNEEVHEGFANSGMQGTRKHSPFRRSSGLLTKHMEQTNHAKRLVVEVNDLLKNMDESMSALNITAFGDASTLLSSMMQSQSVNAASVWTDGKAWMRLELLIRKAEKIYFEALRSLSASMPSAVLSLESNQRNFRRAVDLIYEVDTPQAAAPLVFELLNKSITIESLAREQLDDSLKSKAELLDALALWPSGTAKQEALRLAKEAQEVFKRAELQIRKVMDAEHKILGRPVYAGEEDEEEVLLVMRRAEATIQRSKEQLHASCTALRAARSVSELAAAARNVLVAQDEAVTAAQEVQTVRQSSLLERYKREGVTDYVGSALERSSELHREALDLYAQLGTALQEARNAQKTHAELISRFHEDMGNSVHGQSSKPPVGLALAPKPALEDEKSFVEALVQHMKCLTEATAENTREALFDIPLLRRTATAAAGDIAELVLAVLNADTRVYAQQVSSDMKQFLKDLDALF